MNYVLLEPLQVKNNKEYGFHKNHQKRALLLEFLNKKGP